ncbi:gamma-glutamyl-gamma-aminobutyrate hydrolase family protein [candidate division WOR-3 bacterium]|nr:gamma-glutamyl-gamma-aminobutyrate hydrolase family protein [candidate division WOR-3 bacterium]
MKPIIGINMSYSEFDGYNPGDLRFRDFYTSYTSYVDSVQKSGGMVLLIPPFLDLSSLDYYIEFAQGFLFTGGDDYPPELYNEKKHPETKLIHKRRAEADIYLAREVLKTNKPVLAICGGIQLISIVCGGKLIQHIKQLDVHNKKSKTLDSEHDIRIIKDSLLFKIFGSEEISVNSAHHQAVDPSYIGDGLSITSYAPDGIVESLELESHEERFFLAVQWHPERIHDIHHRELIFDAFIAAVQSSST